VQTVRADDEIHIARGRPVEVNTHVVAAVVDRRHRLAEERLDAAVQRAAEDGSEVRAADRREAIVRRAIEHVHREAPDLAAAAVDEAHLLHLIALRPDARHEPHPLGNVIADPPEVDGVAARAQRRRLLHECRLVAGSALYRARRHVGVVVDEP